jgi:hypothetical protein
VGRQAGDPRRAAEGGEISAQEKLNDAVLYALQMGCFFPVPFPKRGRKGHYSTKALIKWGAMRNLHDAMAEFYREDKPRGR